MPAADTDQEVTQLTVEEELDQLRAANSGDDEAIKALLLDEVQEIVEYLRPVDQKNRRRIRAYLLLRALNVPAKDIADYVGVTAESVRQVLLKARRGRDGTPTKR